MKTSADVVIIGGGVIGCAIAYFLRKQQVDVLLLERGEIGSQASGAAAGLLAPLGPLSGPGPFADLVLAGFAHLSSLIPELETASDVRMEYALTGALRIVRNPKRVAHLQKRFKNWQPLGLRMTWLSGEEARTLEPQLTPDVCAAVYVPEEAQIRASRVVEAFACAARRLGAQLLPRQEVCGLLTSGPKVTGIATRSGPTITCKRLIIASGAWAAQSAAWLNVALPIQPLHGQILALSQPSPPLKHIIFGEAAYLIPRGNTVLVGATKDERGFDQSVTPAGTTWLTSTATRLLPSLAGSTMQSTWAGLRPKTPDSHPILGRLPSWDNVFIAAGHNSTGIILSAITGQSITDLITKGQISPVIQPFAADRFVSQK